MENEVLVTSTVEYPFGIDTELVAENISNLAQSAGVTLSGGRAVTLNGAEVDNVSITGANVSIDNKTANITIPTAVQSVTVVGGALQASISGDKLYLLGSNATVQKADANLILSPASVTLDAGIAQTITASRNGDAIIDWWTTDKVAITRINDNQFKVVGKKCGNHNVGFYVPETAHYYGASKNVNFNVSSEPPVVLMHFNDSSDVFANEGTAQLTTQGTVNTTLQAGYFDTGCYASMSGGLYSFNLGGNDFTVECYLTNKYNTANLEKDFEIVPVTISATAWHLWNFSYGTASSMKQQLAFFADNQTDAENYESAELYNILKTRWRHLAFVYQHNLHKGSIYVGGVKVLEREITCVEQECYLLWYNTCIDELRIIPSAMYTEDFTPPSEPFQ